MDKSIVVYALVFLTIGYTLHIFFGSLYFYLASNVLHTSYDFFVWLLILGCNLFIGIGITYVDAIYILTIFILKHLLSVQPKTLVYIFRIINFCVIHLHVALHINGTIYAVYAANDTTDIILRNISIWLSIISMIPIILIYVINFCVLKWAHEIF